MEVYPSPLIFYTQESIFHNLYLKFLTPHSTPHTLHFTSFTQHFTLHTPHFTLYTPHLPLHTLQAPIPLRWNRIGQELQGRIFGQAARVVKLPCITT